MKSSSALFFTLFAFLALSSAFELPEGKVETINVEGGEVQVELPEEEVSSRPWPAIILHNVSRI